MSIAENWAETISDPDTKSLRVMVLNRIANYLSPGETISTFDWRKVNRCQAEKLKRHFFDDLGMTASSVRFQLATLRSLLRFHVEEGALSEEQLTKVRSVRLPLTKGRGHFGRALSQEEISKLTCLESRTARDRMDAAIFSMLITTGMRASEISNLPLPLICTERTVIVVVPLSYRIHYLSLAHCIGIRYEIV